MSVDYLTFNGTDEYLTVADNAAWDHGTGGSFSWVFELGGDSDLGLNYTILNRSGYYRLAVENGNLFFVLGDNQTRIKLAEGFVPRNSSEFIALTFENAGSGDNHKVRFYRRGAFVKQFNLDKTANPMPANTDTAIYIGADSTSAGFFKGWMNFVMNTDDVLTPSEIATLYNDGDGALDSDTGVSNRVLQFAMNINSTDDTTVTDLSATGVDGTISDSSMSTAGASSWSSAFDDLSMGNPLVFTSTGQDTRPMAISRIVWQGGDIASTDDLLIVDPVHTDQIIIEDVANDSDQTHAHGFWPPFYAAHGIKVKTLDNGEVNVYVV